jgi:ABC-type branched-subunit amino acid transport system ATPase component
MKIIEVDGLDVQFAGLKALDDVSFSFDAGMVCALIGPNGAGKTTLFNAISGYVRPATGAVRLGGRSITGMSAHQVAARGVRRTFQNGGIFPTLTVLENVLCGLQEAIRNSLPGLALRLPKDRRAEIAATNSAIEMLEKMGLAGLAEREAKELSFGQQRRVEIARALICKPRALLLDEPAVGLSAAERGDLGDTLRALAADGMGVLLVEHVLDLVMAVSDKVVVLNHGRMIAAGTPEQVRNDPAVAEAYLGHA